MGNTSIKQVFVELRTPRSEPGEKGLRSARALALLAELWEARLSEVWTPPLQDAASFPWAMTRLSLAALLPGFSDGDKWLAEAAPEAKTAPQGTKVAALFLAGNTPLLALQPIAACLLAGYAVYVKMSRDETLWPRLFGESLAEINPEIASRVYLDVWPGDSDPRTAELAENADVVIAYGSDKTIAALRAITPPQTPFYGYGHAVSVGIVGAKGSEEAAGFARDILMYGQQGCLSPIALFVENGVENPGLLDEVADRLTDALPEEANTLQVSPVTDAADARVVREARDLALFGDKVRVCGDESLRWTLLVHPFSVAVSPPVGHGIVELIPLHGSDGRNSSPDFGALLGCVRGRVSCVGVAGDISPLLNDVFRSENVSRLCAAGEMQTPPLDWPNGGFDLLAALRTHR